MAMDQRSTAEVITETLQPHYAPSGVVSLGGDAGVVTFVGGRVHVDPGTLFEIGSITKIFTAVLVLQLVEEGTLDLDDPIVNHLPSFRLADADATAEVTIRHLLTHTSGIDAADDFTDTGDGDDCLERYLDEVIAGSGLVHPIGEHWSYCNAAYSILGRLIEVQRDLPWDDVLEQQILRHCAQNSVTRPRLGPDRVVAPGHRLDVTTGVLRPEDRPLPRSIGPAGATLLATAEDLVRFALALFRGELLAPALVEEMLRPQLHLPLGDQALAWVLLPGKPKRAVHAGGTLGYTSILASRPDAPAVHSVLTNGPGARAVSVAVIRERSERFGRDADTPVAAVGAGDPAPEAPHEEQLATSACAGTYRRRGVTVVIEDADPLLRAQVTWEPPLDRFNDPAPPLELHPRGGSLFASRSPFADEDLPWVFFDLDADGIPTRLFSTRMHVRTE